MRHLVRSLLLLAVLLAPAAKAVTLGEARVNSFLNQPLDVTIDLIGLESGQDRDLRLRLADRQHFDRLGIVYDHTLAGLRFEVVQGGAQWLVQVRSNRPIAEPFIDFPLQMNWPGGQLVKQYTLLLDPPKRIQPARTASAAPLTRSTAAQIAAPAATDPVYGPVQRGETLWPIAQKLKPQGITTRQMAMALLRANPEAFIDGNLNKLRAGATLAVPPRGFIEQLDPAAARAGFAEQVRRWQAPITTSTRTIETAATPSGAQAPAKTHDTARDADAPAASSQLRIVGDQKQGRPDPRSEQNLQEQLLVTMEEIESNRMTTDAIQSRLTRLESELSRMQQLVELKDAQIAALQSEIRAREMIQQAASATEPALPPAAITPPPERPATATDDVVAQPVDNVAPVVITRLEPVIAPAADRERAWYEQLPWMPWALVGLLMLLVALLMLRRRQDAGGDVLLAELPAIREAPPPPYQDARRPRTEPPAAAEPLPEKPAMDMGAARTIAMHDLDLPERDRPAARVPEADPAPLAEESLLDEMLGAGQHPGPKGEAAVRESDFSEEDIASWVAELASDTDHASTSRSANDERLQDDDDIPSILIEIDDQLLAADQVGAEASRGLNLDPLEAVEAGEEDDTFAMSLDLARAYLEIGDQEGARDMLQQAMAGTRDPRHRQQIEDLLQHLD